LEAVETFEKDVRAFCDEGVVAQWQALEAQVALKDRQNSLRAIRDEQIKARAVLMATMGLSPMSTVTLLEDTPLERPDGSLSDYVLEALLNHPRLAIADRQIAIEKDKVKIAIADFLPSLVGFASRTNTSDSHLMYRNYWAGGLSATLSIFNGFANINGYKAAKENAEKAFVEREQQALTLMLEVVQADLDLTDSEDNMSLAEIAYEAASARYEEIRAHWKEGLVDSAEMLDALARKDQAQANVMNARYRLQVSIATLFNVMGRTDTDIRSSQDDNRPTRRFRS
jgi:outer membrane protein